MAGYAQEIKVEYDKKRDFSHYKTFKFGEGEVITPKERQQVSEAKLHKWIKDAIVEVLTEKGLHLSDTSSDLVASYVVGSGERNENINMGTQMLSGLSHGGGVVKGNAITASGNPNQTWSREYQIGNMIIDRHDKSNNLVWRANATTQGAAAEQLIRQMVSASFKKFSLKPKKGNKKEKP